METSGSRPAASWGPNPPTELARPGKHVLELCDGDPALVEGASAEGAAVSGSKHIQTKCLSRPLNEGHGTRSLEYV